jgi:hypothetical protein
VAAIGLMSGASCARHPQPNARNADGVSVANAPARGIVSVAGTSFDQQLLLRTPTRSIRLSATAADSAALVRVAGAEVDAYGTGDERVLHVVSFVVISVDQRPVADGILVMRDNALALRTVAGVTRLGNPPDALRNMVGARVWISGPLSSGPNSYGVIVPAVR